MGQDLAHDEVTVATLIAETAGAEFLFDQDVHGYLVGELHARMGSIMRRKLKLLAAQKAGDTASFEKSAEEQEAGRQWVEASVGCLEGDDPSIP